MKIFGLALFIFLFHSCVNEISQSEESQLDSLDKPTLVDLQLDSLYNFNLLTGDTIMPVITIDADTLIPGKPFEIKGTMIDPAITISSKMTNVFETKWSNEIADLNANFLVEPDIIPFKWKESIKSSTHQHFTDFILTNSYGEKVNTGVPLTIKGTVSEWRQQKPTPALPLFFTENSFGNLQCLDVDQGLHSSYVLSVMEDSKNNLWFGSYGGGAVRYNGSTFTTFDVSSGLSRDIIKIIFEDSDGNIWFGTTGGGVIKFNGEFFEQFSEEHGMPSDAILCIYEDRAKSLWFGSTRGVSKYDGNSFTHYSEKEGLPNNIVVSINEDLNGNIWFATEGGICRLIDDKWYTLEFEHDLDASLFLSVLCTRDSSIWFSLTDYGLFQYKDNILKKYDETDGLLSTSIWSMIEDQNENIWFGTKDKSVLMYDGNRFYAFGEQDGFTTSEVRTVCEDNRGNLWFGTYGNGVLRFKRNSFYHFNTDDGLSNSIARSIIEDSSGMIYFGTSGGGLCKYDGFKFTHFEDGEDFGSSVIKSLMIGQDGILWIGTNGNGLYKLKNNELTNYSEEMGFPTNRVLDIFEDNIGNIWIGSDGDGVIKCERNQLGEFNQIEVLSEAHGMPHDIVVHISQDKNNVIWIGTDGGGLVKYKDGYITNINEANGLSNKNPLTFLQDQYGNYWAGTYDGGINIFDDDHIIYLTESNGLVNNMVWSITEIRYSDKSDFWVTTEHGINLIELYPDCENPLVKDYSFKIHRFSKQDGLLGLDYYANSALVDSKKRIWWGSGKGIEMLDLNSFVISDIVPETRLDFIEIGEEFIDFRNLSDSADLQFNQIVPFANYPENLVLPYYQNHLTFHFSSIDWSAQHKIAYQFRLLGLNDNWSALSFKNEADYRSIPYGSFTFQVRSYGESQKWSEPFSYEFKILPPWWHTWWFRTLVIVLILFLFYTFYRIRTRSLINRQKTLELLVSERTAEVVHQKELIEEKHREITDSINYAERIQKSFLASDELLKSNLQNYFVFFQPKDIVSGDFYWASLLSNSDFALCCADSTGHGVPGAIMSILNISSLEKSIEKEMSPEKILNDTREIIINRLKKDGSVEGGKDGMDCSLLVLNKEKNKLLVSCANNPVYIVRKDATSIQLIEIEPDKMPVGKHDKDKIPFTLKSIELHKGDMVYTFTDGFPDQFGGKKGKKYMIKNLKIFLKSISDLPMKEQKIALQNEFDQWKGETDQIDDVCVIGMQI